MSHVRTKLRQIVITNTVAAVMKLVLRYWVQNLKSLNCSREHFQNNCNKRKFSQNETLQGGDRGQPLVMN